MEFNNNSGMNRTPVFSPGNQGSPPGVLQNNENINPSDAAGIDNKNTNNMIIGNYMVNGSVSANGTPTVYDGFPVPSIGTPYYPNNGQPVIGASVVGTSYLPNHNLSLIPQQQTRSDSNSSEIWRQSVHVPPLLNQQPVINHDAYGNYVSNIQVSSQLQQNGVSPQQQGMVPVIEVCTGSNGTLPAQPFFSQQNIPQQTLKVVSNGPIQTDQLSEPINKLVPMNSVGDIPFSLEPNPLMRTSREDSVVSRTESSESSDEASAKRSKRSSRACDRCRDKKIRCGPLDPVKNKCKNCLRRDEDCTFNFHYMLEKKKQERIAKKERRGKRKQKNQNKDHKISKPSKENNDNLKNVNADTENPIIAELDPQKLPNKILLDKLVAKIKILGDIQMNTKELFDYLSKITESSSQSDSEIIIKPRYKHYRNNLLTPHKIRWIFDKLNMCRDDKITAQEFYQPLKQHFNEISKYYIIQLKKLTNFESFFEKDENGDGCIFDLPQNKENSCRIIENMHNALLYTTTAIITPKDSASLIDKYYNNKSMTFSEKFLLNVGLLFGIQASITLYSNDIAHVRKDKHMFTPIEMRSWEHRLYINCAFYYNKTTIHTSDLNTLKALLIWSKYSQILISNEVSLDIFTKAINVFRKLGMNEKKFYDNLSGDGFYISIGLLWYCVSTDLLYSVRMTTSPLLRENEDFRWISEKDFINNMTRIFKSRDPTSVDGIDTFYEMVQYSISQINYIAGVITFYGCQFLKIETRLINICFNNRLWYESSFEEILEKSLDVVKELKIWRENLHPLMKLETFRDYYKIISVQNIEQKPEYQFEVVCSRVIWYQFRYLCALVTVNLFIISFVDDNIDQFSERGDKRTQLKQIRASALWQSLENSRKILKTYGSLKNQPFMYRECVYFFYTAMFTVIFRIVDQMGDGKLEVDNLFILEMAHKPYSIILERDQNTKICENIKWNAGYFIYAYFLKGIVNCFRGKNMFSGTFSFDMDVYQKSLSLMTDIARKNRKEQLELLESVTSQSAKISGSSCKLFNDLTPNLINFLKEDECPTYDTIRKYVHNDDPTWQPSLNETPPKDSSLFSPQKSISKPRDEDILEDFNNNNGFFTCGPFFYDRDLSFFQTMKDWEII